MHNEHLYNHIRKKIAGLDKQKDMKEMTLKGKLSFGIDSREYGHLPSWNQLLGQKKHMVRMAWITAIFDSLFIVFIIAGIWDKLVENWIQGLAIWLSFSAIVILFNFIWIYHSMFFYFRQTEREIRRLIYEDILHELDHHHREEQ